MIGKPVLYGLRVNPHCANSAKRVDFVINAAIKKVKFINHLMLMCLRPTNFIKNETLAEAFFLKFCDFFQPKTLIKTRHQHKCFLVNFAKNFENIYFAEHLRRTASNDMAISRFFFKIQCPSKWKIKGRPGQIAHLTPIGRSSAQNL